VPLRQRTTIAHLANTIRRFSFRKEILWSGEQDLNLRQLGICGLSRLE
jgi:hypothetical protein